VDPSPVLASARWTSWDGTTHEELVLREEGSGLVAEGVVRGTGRHTDVHYAVRLGPDFETRQLLLFRDLDDPDLWLGHDGRGRWGEINGVVRGELAGCTDVELTCTPFTATLVVRRLGLAVGATGKARAARIDVETLEVVPVEVRCTRVAERRYRFEHDGDVDEVEVDEDGLVLDLPGRFLRLPG
jgi:hypothetical protein